MKFDLRIGEGFDVHQLVPERSLILGGVTIPHTLGLLGHSDADVLVHAIMDALLGAAALGDIGVHFPDDNLSFKNVSSLQLLKQVRIILEGNGVRPVNVDSTLIMQSPHVAEYVYAMRRNIARELLLEVSDVSVKATTTEGMGFPGRGEGIAARAVALVKAI